ncbi:MAG: chemotaxis response regulator protein-glutamate methylesterase [Firmicutes bacterium HGW-Firmicutes-16]|nr:MAG: chemotaxis response regulator protein-glutamate methylesterase [Firmicutes bacterium HGW-Firmicutes-16]
MPINVLVVDDSIVFRTKLNLSLSKDPEIKVIGTAMDVEDALKKIKELKPDVVTLDIEMPNANGFELLKTVMPTNPLPIVVVSSLPANALDALSLGAVDFVKKPEAGVVDSTETFIAKLIEKIKIASKANVKHIERPSAVQPILAQNSSSAISRNLSFNSNTIIAIGASTGGTEAIINVVKDLPASTPPVLIVQHMPATFTKLYADRLNRICKMRAKEAEDFDRVLPGQIIVGAGGYQMTLKKDDNGYYIRSVIGEKVSGHSPSVNVLFDSVAELVGRNATAVILTGMGSDGASGITKIRRLGGYTIGQDKDSCVVYGMPMEAFKLGGIVKQLPLDMIAEDLFARLKNRII